MSESSLSLTHPRTCGGFVPMKAPVIYILVACALITTLSAVSAALSLRRLDLIPSRADIAAAQTDEAKRIIMMNTPVLKVDADVDANITDVNVFDTIPVEIKK